MDHLDGNKLNNKAENLEWVTHSENTKRWRARNPNFLKIEQYDRERIYEQIGGTRQEID